MIGLIYIKKSHQKEDTASPVVYIRQSHIEHREVVVLLQAHQFIKTHCRRWVNYDEVSDDEGLFLNRQVTMANPWLQLGYASSLAPCAA